jgi:DNA-binding transcriptional ArsR family regulator
VERNIANATAPPALPNGQQFRRANAVAVDVLDWALLRFKVEREGRPMPAHLPPIPHEIRESAALFACLGSPARLNLISLLAAEGELFFGQMCDRTGYTQPAISSQLRILRAIDLVEVRREGTQLFYSIAGGFEGIAGRVQAAVDSVRKGSLKAPGAKRPAN